MHAFKRQWLQLNGDFDPADNAASMFVFFISTLFIFLVMMNILIALLGGTFAKVTDQ
jgi:hypothetical protein